LTTSTSSSISAQRSAGRSSQRMTATFILWLCEYDSNFLIACIAHLAILEHALAFDVAVLANIKRATFLPIHFDLHDLLRPKGPRNPWNITLHGTCTISAIHGGFTRVLLVRQFQLGPVLAAVHLQKVILQFSFFCIFFITKSNDCLMHFLENSRIVSVDGHTDAPPIVCRCFNSFFHSMIYFCSQT
jgi:hypothetical protein